MDLGQIEAFIEVATHRSFSRAAESLRLTQPSVTARIQSLERDMGEVLFERNGRGVTLTDVGTSFLPYAKRVIKAVQDGRDAVESLRRLELGTLRLGAAPTITTYVLPKLLKEFRSRYPGLEVSVRTDYSDRIAQMVLSDEVQLGLERTIRHPDIVTVPLFREEVVMVAAPAHHFVKRGTATTEELGRESLIMFNRGSSYYALVSTALREAGISVMPTMELDNMEATKKMVEEGLGIAFLPRAAVDHELRDGGLREIRVHRMTMPQREVALIYRRGRALSLAAQAFVGLLEQTYGVQAGAYQEFAT